MRIDAITTCVGPLYGEHLTRTLPVWLDTVDSLTVATDRPSLAGWLGDYWLARAERLRVNLTSAFSRRQATFNKGAALNGAITHTKPSDWILSIDCDVLPPPNWRGLSEPTIEPGTLYGCDRHDKPAWAPYGYFQLWHSSDPRGGPFSEEFVDAGGYDTEFFERWPAQRRQRLPFTLKHLGEPRRYWCGPDTTPKQMASAMRRYRARQRTSV